MKNIISAGLLFVHVCANAQVFDASFQIPNGPVKSLAQSGNSLYIGGNFSYIGDASGSGIPLDTITGVAKFPNFPKVDGPIYVVAAEKSGGYYIGGKFNTVGGVSQRNMAYITRAGVVSTGFSPNPDGPVYAIRIIEPTYPGRNDIYVGGDFDNIGGKIRGNLACVNPYYGYAYDNWAPFANAPVRAIDYKQNEGVWPTVYVGGDFTTIDGIPRGRFCAISGYQGGTYYAQTPHTIKPCSLYFSNTVRALYCIGSGLLYVGGDFVNVSSSLRKYVAYIDANGFGSVSSWDPDPNNAVYCFYKRAYRKPGTGLGESPWGGIVSNDNQESILSGSSIMMGGKFTYIGGQFRTGIAEIDTAGLATSWNANSDGAVYSIVYTIRKELFVGGVFENIGGQPRRFGAKLDSNGVAISTFAPAFSDPVKAIAMNDSIVYFAGDFMCMNGVERFNLAAMDKTSGTPTPWLCNTDGIVNALAMGSNNNLFFAGDFDSAQNSTRKDIGEVDLNSGNLTSFTSSTNGYVRAMYFSPGKLYIGGFFSLIGTSNRLNAACIDLATQQPAVWVPQPNGTVNCLTGFADKIYVAGYFTTIGGAPQKYLAATDTLMGFSASTWNPAFNDGLYSISKTNSEIISGGWFTSVNSQNRNNICSASLTSGNLTAFNPNADDYIKCVFVSGNGLYVGGQFYNIAGEYRKCFASFDLSTGQLKNFTTSFNTGPLAFLTDGNFVYAAGDFVDVETDVHAYLVKLNTQYVASVTESANEKLFLVYPNPANNFVTVDPGEKFSGGEIIIFNLSGEKILSQKTEKQNTDIDLNGLSSGIYFVQIVSGETTFIRKLVIAK